MAPTSKTTTASKKIRKTTSVRPLNFGSAPQNGSQGSQAPPLKKFKPLPGISAAPKDQSQSKTIDGKGKQRALDLCDDDQMWVDMYQPKTEADLAVHKKKVEDVRRWLTEAFEGGPSGKLKKYRRILSLTGPAGTAKTATIRVLSQELDFEIIEWRNATGDNFSSSPGLIYESAMDKFVTFLARASSCSNIFPTQTPSSSSKSKKLILLEDLPNILHHGTQERFHDALRVLISSAPSVPVVVIISDEGKRGEVVDERMEVGTSAGGGRWGKDSVDIRAVIPPELLGGPYVMQIAFNPIAPTLLRKALQTLLDTRFDKERYTSSKPLGRPPSKESIELIIESANGDIRSAIMALQFACVVQLSGGKKESKGKGKGKNARAVLEAVTRREQSLALFHLIGKVLYNKRKGDPPNSSASAKDVQREQEADALLRDPPPLPAFSKRHARPTSRVDVDMLYADSPVDSSLLSLYIHQNYTQFCGELEHCQDVSEWLSWVDCSDGDSWLQANPHRFHLLALGTMHALPTPVARRGQKFFKPEFFDYLKQEQAAGDATRDTLHWLQNVSAAPSTGAWRAGGWTNTEICTEIGGVFKAREQDRAPIPREHRLFSELVFSKSNTIGMQLAEGDDGGGSFDDIDDRTQETSSAVIDRDGPVDGGWLVGDDIEDFEP